MIKKIKENKKIKASIFFIFYFFFFLILSIYIKNNGVVPEKKEPVKEIVKTYSIDYLKDNNYNYEFIIDSDKKIKFNGTKTTIDYEDYPYKYFFDIYNINQIIKNSKYLNAEDNVLNYEVKNETLSLLSGIDYNDGLSKIKIYVNEKKDLEKVILDLASFFNKDEYTITLNYKVGENNE